MRDKKYRPKSRFRVWKHYIEVDGELKSCFVCKPSLYDDECVDYRSLNMSYVFNLNRRLKLCTDYFKLNNKIKRRIRYIESLFPLNNR